LLQNKDTTLIIASRKGEFKLVDKLLDSRFSANIEATDEVF
jgi:hypothetical protein